jgi:hypothetical protein
MRLIRTDKLNSSPTWAARFGSVCPKTRRASPELLGYFGLQVLVAESHFSVDLQSAGPVGLVVVCAIAENE